MAYTVPTLEPAELRAGDTWAWRREDLGDYPASTWTLIYAFRNATAYFDVDATADGEAFAVSVAKATTAGYTAGSYDWTAFVSDGSERHEIGRGVLEVLPDMGTAAARDGRSWARQMLDYVEAALLSKATGSQLDIVRAQLAERNLQYDIPGLLVLRDRLRAEVRAEDNADRLRRGLASRHRLLARG